MNDFLKDFGNAMVILNRTLPDLEKVRDYNDYKCSEKAEENLLARYVSVKMKQQYSEKYKDLVILQDPETLLRPVIKYSQTHFWKEKAPALISGKKLIGFNVWKPYCPDKENISEDTWFRRKLRDGSDFEIFWTTQSPPVFPDAGRIDQSQYENWAVQVLFHPRELRFDCIEDILSSYVKFYNGFGDNPVDKKLTLSLDLGDRYKYHQVALLLAFRHRVNPSPYTLFDRIGEDFWKTSEKKR